MPNRRLTSAELVLANMLLNEIRAKLARLSGGNKALLFAYRRKAFKELSYDERSKPAVRKMLKSQKRKEQRGLCAICRKVLPSKYTVLDRIRAVDGYTLRNTRLIHQACDVAYQTSKAYA